MSIKSFNASSFSRRAGVIAGFFMGRAIANIEKGLDAFEELGHGRFNNALIKGAEAIRKAVQVVERSMTKPFALEAREMSLSDEFSKGLAKGVAHAKVKAKKDLSLRRSAPSLKPA